MLVKLLFDIALLLIAAKLFGELTNRLKLTSLVGEIAAGILLGSILGIIRPYESLTEIAMFGVIFLMFLIGLSTRFDEIKDDIYSASYIGVFGCALSFALGFIFGTVMFDLNTGIVLGVLILSTDVVISVRAIIDRGEHHTRAGKMLISANLVDDVFSVMAFTALVSFFTLQTVAINDLFKLLLMMLGFILVISTVGSRTINKILNSTRHFMDEEILVAVSLVIVFFLSAISENITLGYIAGAFLAGMAMSKSHLSDKITKNIKTIGHGLFIPLFFAYSATFVDLGAFLSSFWIIIALVIIGSLAKFVGSGLLSGLFNYHGKEKLIIGIGMIPRGCYSIAIAQIALTMNLISQALYTAVIGFVIITIVITPILMRLVIGRSYSY